MKQLKTSCTSFNPSMLLLVASLVWLIHLAENADGQLLAEKLAAEQAQILASDAERFGDPVRGALAFYTPTMNCARCHEPTSLRRLGPDLSEIREATSEHLVDSVLRPSSEIRKGYETVLVQKLDGTSLQGLLVRESDNELTIDQIERSDKPIVIAKQDVDDWKRIETSTMPDGLANQLVDRQQFLDLIAYLKEISQYGPDRVAELKPAGALAMKPLPEYESRIDHAGLIRNLDDDAMKRGESTYRLRCATCHGTTEVEGSMPTSLRFAEGTFKNGNDPYQMYQTLTHGFGMMNPQRWMVPQQKYEVIHYIREHFLKSKNPKQFFRVTDDYVASLPAGNSQGPPPVDDRPWTRMDYGPSLINTIEVSDDGSNIAQKGIAIRLDDGPGGVESGSHWMMYDHDTMRLAGTWTGDFIDYEGIHFNGVHNRHPRIAGTIQWSNPTGPGWANADGGFEDDRLTGRDNRRYGPLDRQWAHYKGMYRFGRKTLIEYTVGSTTVIESPSLSFVEDQPIYIRNLNLAERENELIVQIARLENAKFQTDESGRSATLWLDQETTDGTSPNAGGQSQATGIRFNGSNYAEFANGQDFDMTDQDFTICARVRVEEDGTIFAQTTNDQQWAPDGKTFFIRDGRPAFDIGWVGAAQANTRIDDGAWHEIVMTWQASDGSVQFFVDGKPSGQPRRLRPKNKLAEEVARIGFTNADFPEPSRLKGQLQRLQFFQRILDIGEIAQPESRNKVGLVVDWRGEKNDRILDESGHLRHAMIIRSESSDKQPSGLLVDLSADISGFQWVYEDDCLRLKIPPGPPTSLAVAHAPLKKPVQIAALTKAIRDQSKPIALSQLTRGGPPNWPETLTTQASTMPHPGPFAVDVLTRPTDNPWNCRLRLTGVDFLPDGNSLVVSAWDGSIWKVSGIADSNPDRKLSWRRIAAGLFQPLGIRWIDGRIYVTCRDQLMVLHDLNQDGEMDWYQNWNNDHQVTEHFHEFAMGLQTDEEGNFYYAKSARHALPALVPHHGTLLKVSADGTRTEILANGFRAANGVCLNPDGSFLVTDQEGHWNPKNRINWVRPGGFYGNMYGYHDVTDESDEAMENPLCWITNSFDRSPSELLWVDSQKWGPLNRSLLNFSYGYGKVYIVLHETLDGEVQGGMCELPLNQFPTGVMRGRFHPQDGHLYCCGMFAWAGNQQQPGGLYRIRYAGEPIPLPISLRVRKDGIEIKFACPLDASSVRDQQNFAISVWDLKRTKNYGSDHYNETRLMVEKSELADDGQTVRLKIPDIKPTWCMEVQYSLRTDEGQPAQGRIHNTIHRLGHLMKK
jgi:putative heme-binding domain-containing protein